MKILAEITIPDGRERFDYEARIKAVLVDALPIPGVQVKVAKEKPKPKPKAKK